MAIHAVIES